MNGVTKTLTVCAVLIALGMAGAPRAMAATNAAVDPGGGSVSLTGSGNVEVLSSALQLVKQVWDGSGNCLASSPADANCNSSATSVTVAAGTTLNFLIFVKNDTSLALTDVRFQDLLSDAEFTYVGASIRRTPNDGTAPADTANLSTIYAAASTAQTDAVDGASQVDEFSSIDTGASPDNLLVGGDGTNNDILSVPANKTFAIRFQAVKN